MERSPEVKTHRSGIRAEWREIGRFGRLAFGGILVSLIVTVVLGLWIPTLVRHHLLEARADLMKDLGDQIASRQLIPVGPPGSESYDRLEEDIEASLLGGDTVRIKLWTADGTVAYSDDPTLVGQRFDLIPAARDALDGVTTFNLTDLSEPAHAHERYLGSLMEFYVPVQDQSGATIGLFEVEQTTDTLDATLAHVRRNVWLAIGTGVGFLGLFLISLFAAAARALDRRRRQAEHLLGALFRVQEEERDRMVGALHDDIGQPLYRLLYGLEGSRARLPEGDPIRAELGRLADLTRNIDRTLRTELRLLHHGVEQDLELVPSLERIAQTTRRETDLEVDLAFDDGSWDIEPVAKTALVRATREAVMNVRKHADARRVTITLRRSAGTLQLEVDDDGVGIRAPEGLGIVTTRERVEALGGTVTVTSGKGTAFRVAIPIGQAE